MVPDEVDPAKRPRRLLDNAPRLLVLRQIGREREGTASCAGDLGHHRLDAGLVDVDDTDRGTLLREAQGTRAAHAGRGRCHDADLVLQAHFCGPPRSGVPGSSAMGSWTPSDAAGVVPCRRYSLGLVVG